VLDPIYLLFPCTELRGFAPIGMLEYWNNGMMGMKEFYQLKYDLFLFYYPLFQYSNIPVIDESGGSLNSYLFNRL
jgi:hypothetical protein